MTSDLEYEMIERDIQERLIVDENLERELLKCRPGRVIWLRKGTNPFNYAIEYHQNMVEG